MNTPATHRQFCGREIAASSRREFLEKAGLGFGMLAASALLEETASGLPTPAHSALPDPLAPKPTHFSAKAKSVIFLFMHGGPSQMDTFDPKPVLNELDGQPVPDSFGMSDFQFTKMARVPLLGSRRTFHRCGRSGLEMSDYFTHLSRHADDLAVIRSMHHDGFTHVTGQNFLNTGVARVGMPSLGSWVVYGLGTERENLPAFMVMLDGPIKAGSPAYGSGFLPAAYQGTALRATGPPILNVNRPDRMGADDQRRMLSALRWCNEKHFESRAEDTALAARLRAYELAFRMQVSVPDLADLSKETDATRRLYGLDEDVTRGFGTQCLFARRMVERGVRFVQLYSGGSQGGNDAGWDAHETCDENHLRMTRKVDKPIAGLLADLKSRGLLESTLVIWGGDFGRTPFTNKDASSTGRDHNPYGFSVWMAGGGIRGGKTIGATDEIGLRAVEDTVHVNDLHATILALLGLDHERLTYRFQGRDFRLTDVGGNNNLAPRLVRG